MRIARERGREKTDVFSLPFFYISEEDKDIIEDGGDALWQKRDICFLILMEHWQPVVMGILTYRSRPRLPLRS
jgi:hypothetical protein